MIGYRAPLGKNAFEFAIYGDDVSSSIVRLTDLFLEHRVRLLSHGFEWDDEERWFAAFYTVDMTSADCSTSTLAEILRSRPDVDSVRVIPRAGAAFSYSVFPIILNGADRGVLFRAKNWFRVEEDLVKWMGSAGESIMYREGETYGISTCTSYKEGLAPQDQGLLFRNVVDGGRSAGWGILDYKMNDDNTIVSLSVKYPVTNSKGEVTSRFFHGMLSGVMEVVLNARLSILESAYDKKSSILSISCKVDWKNPPPKSDA